MTSRDARKAPKALPILTFFAAIAPCVSVAQSTLGSAADRQRAIIELIEEEQSRNGPHSEELIAPLSALALLYEEEGYRELATATIEQVQVIVRANYGLYSLEQVPFIRQLIEHEEDIGRAAAAWELERELLTLARRHPDDVRTVPILREAADKRKDWLDRYLGGEFPPQIALGCYYDWPRTRPGDDGIPGPDMSKCGAGTREDARAALTVDAQRHLAEAIAVLLRNEGGQSEDLRELEMELVESAIRSPGDPFLHRADILFEPWRSWAEALIGIANWDPADPDRRTRLAPNEMGMNTGFPTQYGVGRSALQRVYAQEVASGSWQTQSAALLQIADWDLMHRVHDAALSQYELLYRKLKEIGVAQSFSGEIFAPMTPVVIPTFLPNPLSSNETQGGYVEVAFEITRLGRSRKVEILDSSPSITDSVKERLVDLIEDTQFRPRTTDGRFRRSSPVVVRYYPNNLK
jgi:hypothetical protein